MRPTYESAADGFKEDVVATLFAKYANAQQLKIGQIGQHAHVDRLLYRDCRVIAFFEIKNRNGGFSDYETWIISEKKIEELRRLKTIVCVPVFVVFHFSRGDTIAYIDVDTPYQPQSNFGRYDRGDPHDVEAGAAWAWDQFTTINGA
jgi:hypothetical protein